MTNYDFKRFPISDDWHAHVTRNPPSLGGDDFKCPVGTDITAPGDGTVTYRVAGTGGYSVRIRYDNGWSHEFFHCSVLQFLPNGTRVRQGQHIGESGGAKGAPGAGSSTGPHIHVHAISPKGVRLPYEQAIVPATVPVPKPVTPAVPAGEDDKGFVRRVARYLNNRVLGIDSNSEIDGVRGEAYWTEIQTAGRQDGLYPTSYKIDGIPGAKSRELEQHYGRIAR